MQTATTSAGTSTYLYDADGNLLLQKNPGTTTLYLDNGAEELTLNISANAVSGTRYYTEPDGTTIIRSPAGVVNYEAANSQGTNLETVNATTGIFSLGGATLDIEWNHIHQKLMRGLGIVAIENQARI